MPTSQSESTRLGYPPGFHARPELNRLICRWFQFLAAPDLIRGESAAAKANGASDILLGGSLDGIGEGTFNEIVGEAPTKTIEKAQLDGSGMPLIELLVYSGLSTSKGQARKDIARGGININNVREGSAQRTIAITDLLFGKHLLLRKGKKNYSVVSVA